MFQYNFLENTLFCSHNYCIIEKFDDIKFGKVLTKLYARMFSMEQNKYLPPKYSFALKDLAEFLGIFEVSEEDLKA